LLLLSLSPFPKWPALPASEYYGDSAPSTPFGRQRAYPQGSGASMVPTFTVVRSTGEAPGFAPAVSSWLRRRPSPRPARPDTYHRPDSSPPPRPPGWWPPRGGYAPHTSPDPPGSSWSTMKRLHDTGSLRTPSRLAHQARPVR